MTDDLRKLVTYRLAQAAQITLEQAQEAVAKAEAFLEHTRRALVDVKQ